MEPVKLRGHKKRFAALINFLEKHPRYLPSDLMLNCGVNDRSLCTTDQSCEESRIGDLFVEISKIRNKAISALGTKHDLNFEQIMAVTLRDIDLEKRAFAVRQRNGSVAYYLNLDNDTAEAISAYLRVRSPTKEDKLFLSDSDKI